MAWLHWSFFVFGDLCIFYERFVPRFLWSFLFSVKFAFSTREVLTLWQKPPWFHWLFFWRWIWQPWTVPSQNCMWKICQKKTAGEKAPSQHCRWKNCEKFAGEKAPSNTAGGARPHPKTVDEACNFDWGPLSCVQRYLAALPTLKHGSLQGCSRSKVPLLGLSPGPRSSQVSVFLPNDLSLGWLVCRGLRSMMCQACGNVRPQWRSLQQHLETKGWLVPACRKRRAALYQQI